MPDLQEESVSVLDQRSSHGNFLPANSFAFARQHNGHSLALQAEEPACTLFHSIAIHPRSLAWFMAEW
jgi:hypothetical protein